MDAVLRTYLLVFAARFIISAFVSMRTIYSIQGRKFLAPFMGFFEASIFVMIMSGMMGDLDKPLLLLAYGLGYGGGSVFGMLVEDKIGLGRMRARIIPKGVDNDRLKQMIWDRNLGLTTFDGMGRDGVREILVVSLERKDLIDFRKLVHQIDPEAFVSIMPVNARGGFMKRMQVK